MIKLNLIGVFCGFCCLAIITLAVTKYDYSDDATSVVLDSDNYHCPWIQWRYYIRVLNALENRCHSNPQRVDVLKSCNQASTVGVRYVNCVKNECAKQKPPKAEKTGYYAYEGRPEFSGDFKHPYADTSVPAGSENQNPWLRYPLQKDIFSGLISCKNDDDRQNVLWDCGKSDGSPDNFGSCVKAKCGSAFDDSSY